MEAAGASAQASKGAGAATSVAIVGGSEHAAAVARRLRQVPGVSITAVCAPASEPAGRFAVEAGIRLVGDPLEPLASTPAPDIILDLSEDVVTRTALEAVLPPGTELLGGSAVDLVWDVLEDLRWPSVPEARPPHASPAVDPLDPDPEPAEEGSSARERRLQATNEALSRTNRDLEADLAEVYFMHEFVKALVAYRRVDDVSSVVVDASAGILGADAAGVYLLDRERWVLTLSQGQGRPPESFLAEVGLNDPLLGQAFAQGFAFQSRASQDVVRSRWLAPHSARVSSQAAVSLLAAGEPIGVLVLGWSSRVALEQSEVDRLRVVADQSALSLQNALLHAELERLSVTDRLTELFNHGYVTQRFEQELGRAGRFGHCLSVIMLDIDDFKSFNDRYGHLVGDDVLRAVSGLIRENLREMDVAARFGGEEFVVLVPETAYEGACAVAERIRLGVAGHAFLHDAEGDVHTTVSAGVATFPRDGTTVESLLEAADQAMYRAKRAGKDRVGPLERSAHTDEPPEAGSDLLGSQGRHEPQERPESDS